MANDGKAYEALTEQVFRRLLDERLCAEVRRDVKLEGRTTTHQIDVHFRFRAGDVEYQTLVQCKDWGAPVKQEQVLAFRAVLDDVPGQPRGIIVARSGFQSGARRVAEQHGIVLYELREPRDEDWDGLVREVQVHGMLDIPGFRIGALRFDTSWIRDAEEQLGLPRATAPRAVRGTADRWFTASGEPVDVRLLLRPAIPDAPTDWKPFDIELSEPHDVEGVVLDGSPLTRLRVLGITGEVKLGRHEEDWTFRTDHLVAYCFRDVLGEKSDFLDADGARLGDRKSDK